MERKVHALVLTGYGINCEREMAYACEMAGASATIAHAKYLFNGDLKLNSFDLLCFPGGFSFGDELGAAKALANRIEYGSQLKDHILQFVENGKCVVGICNGFQLLVKLGLLPGNEMRASLVANDSAQFQDRWVEQSVEESPCVFTRGIESIYLPIRHGEGKFVLEDSKKLEELKDDQKVVLRYKENPNGSLDSIAGLCDSTGRILGMMAHPEAAVLPTHHPHWHKQQVLARREGKSLPAFGPGYPIFENAVNYLKETL